MGLDNHDRLEARIAALERESDNAGLWIVYRVISDARTIGGTRTRPVGWVVESNMTRAQQLAEKHFGRPIRLEQTTGNVGHI